MAARDHSFIIFSTILPDNLTAFRYAQQILTEDHFPKGSPEQSLWGFLEKYAAKYGGVPTDAWLLDKIQSMTVRKSDFVVLEDAIVRYAKAKPSSLSAFEASVDALHGERMQWKTGNALDTAFEILLNGVTVEGEDLRGHEAAREYVMTRIREIEAEAAIGDVSEGDLVFGTDFLEEYERVKTANLDNTGGGIGFGIRSVDQHTGGVSPGDLVLVAAYTGQGKTQVLCQMAWHAAIVQKKNVFFSTTETVRRQVEARIVARHSREPKFELPGGLNSRHILKGTLTPEHEEVMRAVERDLGDRANEYGAIKVSQTPHDATLTYVESRITAWQQHTERDPHLVLIDSVYLLRSPRKRNTEREEFNELLRDTKRMATAMAVPIVTPWQIRREAWERAVEGQEYGLAAMSDTSEAEKSASLIMTLLSTRDEEDLVRVQIPKNRDGEAMPTQVLHIDYRNAYLSDSADSEHSVSSGVAFDPLAAF